MTCEPTELSDGTSLCDQFLAAARLNAPALGSVRRALATLALEAQSDEGVYGNDEEPEKQAGSLSTAQVKVTYEILTSALDEFVDEAAAGDDVLTARDFNAVVATLTDVGVAEIVETDPRGVWAYTFGVECPAALRILDQQIVVAKARSTRTVPSDTEIDLVATLPKPVEEKVSDRADRIDLELRRIVLRADESLRVATPYWGPDERVVQDVATAPNRGVETQILTREVVDPNTNEQTVSALTDLVAAVDEDSLDSLSIADFYEREHGVQTGATHAKVMVADEEVAYVGSANLTKLSLSNNYEFGVLLRGDAARDVAAVFDAIFEAAENVSVSSIRSV